jgi:hypothetical protein
MEMKSEYNHGTIEYYHLELHGRNINKGLFNAYKALKALRKLGHYSNYSFWRFWSWLRGKRSDWAFFQGLYTFDEAEYYHHLNVLTAAGTSPEACHRTVHFIVPNDKTEIDNEYIDKYFHFSRLMNDLGEYSLEKWAMANNVPEAYRLLEYSSSFADRNLPRVIRVWRDATEIQYVIRKLVNADFCERKLTEESYGEVNLNDWQNLHQHMISEFWVDKVWAESRGADASTYYFEGYYEGKFKIARSIVGYWSWRRDIRNNELEALGFPPNPMPHLDAISLFYKLIKTSTTTSR